jgi:hypothetical protein
MHLLAGCAFIGTLHIKDNSLNAWTSVALIALLQGKRLKKCESVEDHVEDSRLCVLNFTT